MKINTILYLLSLFFYPCSTISADSSVSLGKYKKSVNSIYLNASRERGLTQRKKIDDLLQGIKNKISYNSSKNQTSNRAGHEYGNDCSVSEGGGECVFTELLSMGTTSSYIDEYSMFAVIGSGIKLSEEQIESFNGIDDYY